jgi:hypothetical protein
VLLPTGYSLLSVSLSSRAQFGATSAKQVEGSVVAFSCRVFITTIGCPILGASLSLRLGWDNTNPTKHRHHERGPGQPGRSRRTCICLSPGSPLTEGAVAFRPLNTAQLPALSSRAQFGATSAKQAERSAVDPDPNRSLNHLTVPPVPRLWGPGRAAHHHPVRRQDRANTEALRLVTRARLQPGRKRACL